LIKNNNFIFPKIIGHRGVKDLYPENTYTSILAAFNLGLECVEIDVKISKDRIPFLLHDETFDRTTNGKGNANLKNYSDIKNLDAGSFFYNKKTNIHIPTLDEILQITKKKNKSLNIELKPNINLEKENVYQIINIVKNYEDIPIYYSSFDLTSCIELISKIKNAYCGLIIDKFIDYDLRQIIELSKKYNFYACGLNAKIITSDVINILNQNKLIVYTYSEQNINYKDAKELFNIGVKSLVVDDPKDLLSFL
tara:strand:+ start:19600 stop:20355 length:756 start_codon:yes stop_codon:yes gene_type:complete